MCSHRQWQKTVHPGSTLGCRRVISSKIKSKRVPLQQNKRETAERDFIVSPLMNAMLFVRAVCALRRGWAGACVMHQARVEIREGETHLYK